MFSSPSNEIVLKTKLFSKLNQVQKHAGVFKDGNPIGLVVVEKRKRRGSFPLTMLIVFPSQFHNLLFLYFWWFCCFVCACTFWLYLVGSQDTRTHNADNATKIKRKSLYVIPEIKTTLLPTFSLVPLLR